MRIKSHRSDGAAIRWIAENAKGQYLRLMILILMNMAIAGASVVYALVSKWIVDSAVSGEWDSLMRNAALMGGLILADVLLRFGRNYLREYVETRFTLGLQERLIAQLFRRDYSSIADIHSGELLNRMFSDVNVVAGGVVGILPSMAYLCAKLIGASGALLALAPQFALLFIVGGVAVFFVMTLRRERIKKYHKRMQESEGRMRAFAQEIAERLLVIKVFRADEAVRDKHRERQEEYAKDRMQSRLIGIISSVGFGLVFDMGRFLAMVWGCMGILSGSLTYGTLTAMLSLVTQVQQPFSGFSHVLSQVYSVTASAERLMEMEGRRSEELQPELEYADLSDICFDHVSFTYGRDEVLKDVDVSIRKGDVVSITGISGGGKSTLFLLLMGAYKPTAGEIRFESAGDVQAVQPGYATRRLFAYVPQGNYLMTGTIRENLTFFRKDVDESAVWSALDTACAAEFVRQLPEGLETHLGEKGHGLSEGQMQRIAVARALISGAPILLLDEATSALDDDTEAQLLRNLSKMQRYTCLIVTHRKSALAICKRHLMLQDGHVYERPELGKESQ